MKKAARTNTKYMMRLDSLIGFLPFFFFFFILCIGDGLVIYLLSQRIE